MQIECLCGLQVELPLGATEDRICGTLDIERALQEAVKALEPGLLARANRGIMYIDEVGSAVCRHHAP